MKINTGLVYDKVDAHRVYYIHEYNLKLQIVYRYEDDVLVLTLARTGTHSDLFNL